MWPFSSWKSLCRCLFLPWATWAELLGGLCKTETFASCPAGKASRSTEESSLRHHRKRESEHIHWNVTLSHGHTTSCMLIRVWYWDTKKNNNRKLKKTSKEEKLWPLSSDLHPDARWRWRWATSSHVPVPPLGSDSTLLDSDGSATHEKEEHNEIHMF